MRSVNVNYVSMANSLKNEKQKRSCFLAHALEHSRNDQIKFIVSHPVEAYGRRLFAQAQLEVTRHSIVLRGGESA